MRVFEEANLGESSSEQLSKRPRPPPRLAAESAASFKVELAEMKRILDEQGTKLPADRFDESNAELLRFAASAGLLQVRMIRLTASRPEDLAKNNFCCPPQSASPARVQIHV